MNRDLVNDNHPSPLFFVSVASKGFKFYVSLLFSTLARGFASVDFKRLTNAIHLLESSGMGHENFKELATREQRGNEITR